MNKTYMFVFAVICIIVFFIFYYIFIVFGNNKFRNQKEWVEDIFEELESYEANIEVIITSNKNENIYNMKQIVNKDYSKLILNSPESVSGLTLENKNNILRITNSNIDMKKIFENYKKINDSFLYLTTFIKEYEENESTVYEENGEILIEILLNNGNTYIKSKVLYLDKETKLPKRLIIKDNAQNINTSIIYNDIKIK